METDDDDEYSWKLPPASLYWGDWDQNVGCGWWLRYKERDGSEEVTPIDGDGDESLDVLATSCATAIDHLGRTEIAVYRDDEGPREGWIVVAEGNVVTWRIGGSNAP